MAPYAATLNGAREWLPCKYLLNIDHDHFRGTYFFLAGTGRELWEWSVVLRRILYPILAYPFMAIGGYELGGFIFNLILYGATLLLYVRFSERTIGRHGAHATAWLLATYPGIAYWAGLPYSYAIIPAASLLAFTCLYGIDRATHWHQTLLPALGIGIASTGYDLLPFFAPASLIVLAAQRRWSWCVSTLVLMGLPSLLVSVILRENYGVTASNSNTASYLTIVGSYLNPPSWDAWWPLIRDVPFVLVHNFFFSNFLFLPAYASLLFALRWCSKTVPSLSRVEHALVLSIGAVFLFNNLAPPYEGWQLRGVWIARIYQPLFVVFLSYSARTIEASHLPPSSVSRLVTTGLWLTVTLNAAVIFGPVTSPFLAEPIYYNFYRHSPEGTLSRNLKLYGQRPIGFCHLTTPHHSDYQ
jgi:hypothetical protein